MFPNCYMSALISLAEIRVVELFRAYYESTVSSMKHTLIRFEGLRAEVDIAGQ